MSVMAFLMLNHIEHSSSVISIQQIYALRLNSIIIHTWPNFSEDKFYSRNVINHFMFRFIHAFLSINRYEFYRYYCLQTAFFQSPYLVGDLLTYTVISSMVVRNNVIIKKKKHFVAENGRRLYLRWKIDFI